MCLYSHGSYHGMSKTLASVSRLMNESEGSPTQLPNCPSVLYPDRIRAKQHYDCFPEYSYNTAFVSLLTGSFGVGVSDIDELHADSPLPIKPSCDGDAPSSDHVRILTVDQIQHLIRFLNEFLPFLPSIIDDYVHYCPAQRMNMMNLIEHLHQLRSDLLREITNYSEYPTSVISFDILTVSVVLQQLNSLLRQLNSQEQCSTSNSLSIHRRKLIQWGNHLEALTASSMRIMKMRSYEEISSSTTIPALDSSAINHHSFPVTDDFPQLCIPWPVLEPTRNLCPVSCLPESTFDVEDEVRPRKTRKSHRKDPKSTRPNLTEHLMKSTPYTSSQERSRFASPPSTSGLIKDDARSPLSIRSILSKTKQTKTEPGSAVQSKSNIHSKQSSPLLRTTSTNNQSDSTHPAVQQSRDKDRQSDASSTWSYQTYAYGAPSRMTPESEQNLSSGHDPSFVGQPSMLDSHLSANLTPEEEKKSTRSFALGRTPDTLTTKSALNERFESNERSGLDQWGHHRTGSPSIHSINDVSSRQNILSSNLSSPFPMNDTESDLNFDGYSNNPRSPSVNLQLKQTTGQLTQLNVIERPRSAEGTSSLETPSLPKRSPKTMNTEFDLTTRTDRYQQQSASARSSSEQSFSDEHRNRRVVQAHLNQLKKRSKDDGTTGSHVTPTPFTLTRQGYFDKLMTCVRRTLVNRANRSQYRTQ